jgi:two-component system sensor histidine kinase/response regulator
MMQTNAKSEVKEPSEESQEAHQMPSEGRVLVVDDMAVNVRLLTGILKLAGYDVLTAGSGREALDHLQTSPVDVVLLDVMMPEMDGFEVCRRIKAQNLFLPVVMVTALQETGDRVTALEAGADDFLTKPVDEIEVLARVKSLVRLKRQREELDRAYRELRRVETMRDDLTYMIVHDLRTPLTSLLSGLQSLELLGELTPDQLEVVWMSVSGGQTLLSIINDLLDIGKMESGTMELHRQDVVPATLIDEAAAQVAGLLPNKRLTLTKDVPETLPLLRIDRDKLSRTLVNLLGNAIKFTPPDGRITLAARHDPAQSAVVFSVSDTGEGIPKEAFGRIFEKFGQAETRKAGRKMSTGLGLTFCKMTVEAHGGRIWVESEPEKGSTFSFSLPITA